MDQESDYTNQHVGQSNMNGNSYLSQNFMEKQGFSSTEYLRWAMFQFLLIQLPFVCVPQLQLAKMPTHGGPSLREAPIFSEQVLKLLLKQWQEARF